jgi:gluconolactonase
MNVEIRDARFTSVVGDNVEFEKIATGFRFTEGPLWHPKENFLLFTDIAGNKISRWSQEEHVNTFREPSNMSNGLTYDQAGNVLACEHATSQVTRRDSAGTFIPIASHYEEKQLNSPNDIVCTPDGRIYFTDPPYGRVKFFGVKREQELPFQGVFRVGNDPEHPVLLVDDFDRPNGLCFSLDLQKLFVNDTARQHIRVFDVQENDALSGGGVWAETKGNLPGAPDGMKIDSVGNLYCCGPGGIHVFAPDATCLGVLRVPEYTANLTFGDADFRSLYITASKSVYRIRTKVAGRPVF